MSPSAPDNVTPPAAAPLSVREKVGYAVGDTASHFVWDMVGFWLLVFYTDTLGIGAAAAGTIMLIARVWDMVTDPIMGVVSDRTRTRWGKFRPYVLWMAVPYAVLAVAAFSTPDFSETGRVIWAGATYVLLMTVFTAINLPYSSLAGVMSADTDERTSLNQYRFVFAFLGQLIVSGTALTLVAWLGGGDDVLGYRLTVALFAVVAVALFMVTFFSTRERIAPPKEQTDSLRADVKNLFRNRPWLVLFGVGLCSFTLFALQNAVTAFYFEYYVGDGEQAQLFNVTGTVALMAAVPLAKPLAKRFGNRNVFMVCSVATGFWYLMLYVPSPDQLVLIYGINILGKIAYAPTVPLLWTMIANTADYSEWLTGRRATGLFFSAATLSMKFGWGVGGALAGYLLAWYGYEANQAQSATAIEGIRLMMTAYPASLYLVAAVLLSFYGLTKESVARMQAELALRRAGDEDEAPGALETELA